MSKFNLKTNFETKIPKINTRFNLKQGLAGNVKHTLHRSPLKIFPMCPRWITSPLFNSILVKTIQIFRKLKYNPNDTNRKYRDHENIIIGDPPETHRDRLAWSETSTCQIGDSSETDIGNRHACGIQSEFKHIFKYKYFYILFAYLYTYMSVSD